MSERRLLAKPLTAERFAPFGEVIAADSEHRAAMNAARFERFDDLAAVDIDDSGDGHVAISIAKSRVPSALPYRFDTLERHPLGSQAFIPLTPFRFVVVVAEAGEAVGFDDLRAFVTNGHQGINYRRGTWHMPLISLEEGQAFLIVDRAGVAANCEERVLGDNVLLELP